MPFTQSYLFVYGTLRKNFNNSARDFLARNAEFFEYAVFQGKLYKVDDYPAAIPSENTDEVVHGEVYRLKKAGIVLAQLDNYEECSLAFAKPTEYVRAIHRVRLRSGKTIKAWVYLYNWPVIGLDRIVSGDFLDV